MKVEYFKEYSNCLNREMEFKIYGHTGIPLLVFPAQDGHFYWLLGACHAHERNSPCVPVSWRGA